MTLQRNMVQHFGLGSTFYKLQQRSRFCSLYGLLAIDACLCANRWGRPHWYVDAIQTLSELWLTAQLAGFTIAVSSLWCFLPVQLSQMSCGSSQPRVQYVACASKSHSHLALQVLHAQTAHLKLPPALAVALSPTLQWTSPGLGMPLSTQLM